MADQEWFRKLVNSSPVQYILDIWPVRAVGRKIEGFFEYAGNSSVPPIFGEKEELEAHLIFNCPETPETVTLPYTPDLRQRVDEFYDNLKPRDDKNQMLMQFGEQ